MKTYATMNGCEPAVDQPDVNGWAISWNPDDGRWYIERPNVRGPAVATFKDRRNAVRYAKTHRKDAKWEAHQSKVQ
jgi:hypothetical protein